MKVLLPVEVTQGAACSHPGPTRKTITILDKVDTLGGEMDKIKEIY